MISKVIVWRRDSQTRRPTLAKILPRRYADDKLVIMRLSVQRVVDAVGRS